MLEHAAEAEERPVAQIVHQRRAARNDIACPHMRMQLGRQAHDAIDILVIAESGLNPFGMRRIAGGNIHPDATAKTFNQAAKTQQRGLVADIAAAIKAERSHQSHKYAVRTPLLYAIAPMAGHARKNFVLVANPIPVNFLFPLTRNFKKRPIKGRSYCMRLACCAHLW
jgi:hypothetical protein